VVVLIAVTSSGSSNNSNASSSGSTPTTNAPSGHHRGKTKPAFSPSSVSVGVLNGTATAGLAAKVMSQLAGTGYKQGITPANAASQTQATTAVLYTAGHKADAVAVARSLKLSSNSVQPIDSGNQAIACPQTTSCSVDVVVTVGQDLANG
jgi:predicted alpha/beta-fold hydrolase